METKRINIFLMGGGTGGTTVPLLTVAKKIKEKEPSSQFSFIGTNSELDKKLAGAHTLYTLPEAKLARYLSYKTIVLPFALLWATLKSYRILSKYKPDLVFGAGGFTQVPVSFCAWLLHIPIVIHQQDVYPSLSNKLIAPFATKITTSVFKSTKDFPSGLFLKDLSRNNKITWTGNPVREELRTATKEAAVKYFKLDEKFPTILITGGGSGAVGINTIVEKELAELTRYFNVIHAAGIGKMFETKAERYYGYEFINRMDLAMAAADIVVSRAGMSTITELSYLGKLAIVVPIPHSHQVLNASFLHHARAALVVEQAELEKISLTKLLRNAIHKPTLVEHYKQAMKKLMPHNADEKIADIILGVLTHGTR